MYLSIGPLAFHVDLKLTAPPTEPSALKSGRIFPYQYELGSLVTSQYRYIFRGSPSAAATYVCDVPASKKPLKSPEESGSPATYVLFGSPKAVTSSLSATWLIDQAAANGMGVATPALVADR